MSVIFVIVNCFEVKYAEKNCIIKDQVVIEQLRLALCLNKKLLERGYPARVFCVGGGGGQGRISRNYPCFE